MRIMISKWIFDKVKQRNPTLAEYVDNYGSLNQQSQITAKSNEMADTNPVNWEAYITNKCGEVNACDKSNECVRQEYDTVKSLEFGEDETFTTSFDKHCAA